MWISLIVLHLATFWQLNCAQSIPRQIWHSRHSYPNPMKNPVVCNRGTTPSYICDPDRIIVPVEADQLNSLLVNTVNETRCPCSRYSCTRNMEGFKIGIALTRQIKPDQEFESRSDDDRAEETRRAEFIMNEGKLFAHALLGQWDLGRCDEDVIIFYSMSDGILYTAVGDVARTKLNHTVIKAISMNARGDFGAGGNVFKGLLKIVKEYRSVFFGAYSAHGRPTQSEIRSAAGPPMELNAGRVVAALLASFLVVVLTCLAS